MNDMFLDVVDEINLEDAAEGRGDEYGFVVDTDQKAEWVLKKIRDEEEEFARIENGCVAEIERYRAAMDAAWKRCEKRTANLRTMLNAYMGRVKTKETKTQSSYTLPSAKLVIKHKQPKVIRDDGSLMAWMRENAPEYINVKTVYTPMWAELKDTLTVSGGEYMTADGVIVDGVKLETLPDEFVIQFN